MKIKIKMKTTGKNIYFNIKIVKNKHKNFKTNYFKVQ